MEKVILHKSKTRISFISVCENATPGSFGSHQLLLQQYRNLDDSWESKEDRKWRQLSFTTNFLKGRLKRHGELHCEYCGKPNLVIYHPNDRNKKKSLMATADHFLPKSKHPEFAFDESNLKVCCYSCNQKKEDHYWSEETIQYPYPTIQEKQTIFVSTKKQNKIMQKFKVTSSSNSVSVRNTKTGGFISIQIGKSSFEARHSTDKTDLNGIVLFKQTVKDLVSNKMDKKLPYKTRFAKIVNVLNEHADVTSFKVLSNRLATNLS